MRDGEGKLSFSEEIEGKKKRFSQLFSEPSSWPCRVGDLTAHLFVSVCVPSVVSPRMNSCCRHFSRCWQHMIPKVENTFISNVLYFLQEALVSDST